MSPFALVLLFLLFLIGPSDAVIQCLVSPAAEFGKPQRPVLGQCYQNWCKKVTGGTGVVEYGCDDTGDCSRNANNDPYDPYVTQISNCWSKNGRSICCCNTDFCSNGGSSHHLIPSLICLLASLLFLG